MQGVTAGRSILSFAVMIAILLVGGIAQADPPGENALPIHVVSVKSTMALDQGDALTQALKKAVRDSKGWSLGDSNQSLQFLALEMECSEPIDSACETRIADHLRADRFLWAVLDFEEGNKEFVSGTLSFFERGKGTSSTTVRYSSNLTDPNDDFLIEEATKAFTEVTGGAPKGKLRVTNGGIAGQVYVDGEAMGALPEDGVSLQLPAGEHSVLVKAPGHQDAEATAVVKPLKTVEISLTMIEAEAEEPVDGRIIGGAAALGVGAVALGVGIWASTEVNGLNDDRWNNLVQRTPKSVDLCNEYALEGSNEQDGIDVPTRGEAHDICQDAPTFEIMQAVMYPVAGVAAGLGLYLLGTSSLVAGDEDGSDTAIMIVPTVMPGTQALTVVGTF